MNGLRYVGRGEPGGPFQVGNGPGDLKDAVVGPGAQAQTLHGHLQEALALRREDAVLLQEARGHVGVGKDAAPGKAPGLSLPGLQHQGPHLRGAFRGIARGQFPETQPGHRNVHVDAVQQRPGDAAPVLLDLFGGAGAGPPRVAEITARAGVHGRHQHHPAWVSNRAGRPGDGDPALFQGLAQHLQGGTLELRQLVQEEDPVVGQAYLAGPGVGAAADETGVGDGVVRVPEGPHRDQGLAGPEAPHDAVDLGGLQGLLKTERRQDRRDHSYPICLFFLQMQTARK